MRTEPSLTVAPFDSYEVKPFGPISSAAKAIHAYWRKMESRANTTKVAAGHRMGDALARKQLAERIAESTGSTHENGDREHVGEGYSYRYVTNAIGKADLEIRRLESCLDGALRRLAVRPTDPGLCEDATKAEGHLAKAHEHRERMAEVGEIEPIDPTNAIARRLAVARQSRWNDGASYIQSARDLMTDEEKEATRWNGTDLSYVVKPAEIKGLSDVGRAWFRKAMSRSAWRKLTERKASLTPLPSRGTALVASVAIAEPSVKARKPRKVRAVAVAPVVPVVSGDYLTPSDDSTARMFAALECDQLAMIDGQVARDWYASDAAHWPTVARLESAEYRAMRDRINAPAPLPVARKRGRPTNASKADDLLMQALAILEGADLGEYDAADKAVSKAWERRNVGRRGKVKA